MKESKAEQFNRDAAAALEIEKDKDILLSLKFGRSYPFLGVGNVTPTSERLIRLNRTWNR